MANNIMARVLYEGQNVWFGEGVIDDQGKIIWSVQGGVGTDGDKLETPNQVYYALSKLSADYKPSLIEIKVTNNK